MTASVAWLDEDTARAARATGPSFLTVILTLDSEKGVAMTRRFFSGLRLFNPTAIPHLQVIAIDQTPTGEHEDACRQQPFPVEYRRADHPAVEGYPIWDVFQEVRHVWPTVRGEYVTFAHAEFCTLPGDWARTCAWLDDIKPPLAIGNLRRLIASRTLQQDAERGDRLNAWFDAGEWVAFWSDIARHGHRHWIYWLPEPTDNGRWLEDMVFARRDYLELTRFFEHGGEQPFQDVYDVFQAFHGYLAQHGIRPRVPRIPRTAHTAFHLWHPRPWGYARPAVRDWFFANPERWYETTCLRRDLWDGMIDINEGRATKDTPVADFRRAPGGTVQRWSCDFLVWLQNGGADLVREYLAGPAQPTETDSTGQARHIDGSELAGSACQTDTQDVNTRSGRLPGQPDGTPTRATPPAPSPAEHPR